MVGTVIADRYRVDSQLGVGGMGIVYKAYDTRLLREVALKVIAPHLTEQDKAAQRFMREAQALAGLTHPNIVTVFDQLEDPASGKICIIMELLQGASLRQRLKGSHRPKFEEMAPQLCRALETAHGKGILHRDIKPENIFVCDDGTVKLMDFGLARILDANSSSQSSVVVGTAQYMAPEQLKGEKQDGRTDLYALGVVFYEFLSGIQPFSADNPGAIMMKHLTEMPPPLTKRVKNLAPEIEAIVMRLLAKDPKDRFNSAHDLRDALTAQANGSAKQQQAPAKQAAPPPPAIPLTPPKQVVYPGVTAYRKHERRASKGGGILLIALLILLSVGGAAYYFGKDKLVAKPKSSGSTKEKGGKSGSGSSSGSRRKSGGESNPDSGSSSEPNRDNSSVYIPKVSNSSKDHTNTGRDTTSNIPTEPTAKGNDSEPSAAKPESGSNEHQPDDSGNSSGDSEKN